MSSGGKNEANERDESEKRVCGGRGELKGSSELLRSELAESKAVGSGGDEGRGDEKEDVHDVEDVKTGGEGRLGESWHEEEGETSHGEEKEQGFLSTVEVSAPLDGEGMEEEEEEGGQSEGEDDGGGVSAE